MVHDPNFGTPNRQLQTKFNILPARETLPMKSTMRHDPHVT